MDSFIDYWMEKSKPFLRVKDDIKGRLIKSRLIVLKHPKGAIKMLHVIYDDTFIRRASKEERSYNARIGAFAPKADLSFEVIENLCDFFTDTDEYQKKAGTLVNSDVESYFMGQRNLAISSLEGMIMGNLFVSRVVMKAGGAGELFLRDKVEDSLIPACIQISGGIRASVYLSILSPSYIIDPDVKGIIDFLVDEFNFIYLGVRKCYV